MTDQSGELRTVVVEREMSHPPEKVWRALTQPHLIAEWLMKNDFKPDIGHHFQFKGDWGGVIDGEVLAIEPNRKLVYRWDFANDDPLYSMKSVVTMTLTPTGSGTHLRVEQEGFRPEQKQAYGGAIAGWKQFLGNLDELVAKLD
jgi:uncharacterized protein YndB with AHSA1/START domain